MRVPGTRVLGGDLPLRVVCAPFLVHFQWLIQQARATDLNRDFDLAPFSVASLSRREWRKGKTATPRAREQAGGLWFYTWKGFPL